MSFPSNPVNGQTVVVNSISYTYNTSIPGWTRNQAVSTSSGISYTANTSPPVSATITVGSQWYNTATDVLYEYTYDGVNYVWVDISSSTFNGMVSTFNFVAGSSNNVAFYGNIGASTTSPLATLDMSQRTDMMILPVGNTAQRPGTAANGAMRFNTSSSSVEVYNGTQWLTLGTAAYTANYLVVGGGGGGNPGGTISAQAYNGGAGGAGGLISGTTTLTPATVYTITVGSGGSSSANGLPSSAFGVTALGGGLGGGTAAVGYAGYPGGSGGGGCNSPSGTGGAGTNGQGNAGGAGYGSGSPYTTGGGGGAGAIGGSATNSAAGNGGVGLTTTLITTANATSASVGQVVSTSVYFAGGGGGVSNAGGTAGTGGNGGGGNGALAGSGATSGSANTGGGGGGAGTSGGSGVVIISVPTSNYSGITTGSPTVLVNGTNTVLIFKSSGSYTA